ncbi:MAG: Allantoicase [Myxococcaceae bacterium]|nr:Allantoicase [Myxococcaceae bacterium]
MKATGAATFTGLVDLAAEELGGRAVSVSDDFFAGVENMLRPGRAVFLPDEFTERGKWMDGWESRRKRTPGHDWALLELGASGHVLGFDVDTQHFSGNQPAYVSVEGVHAERGTPVEALEQLTWMELLAQSPVRPDAQNLFAAEPTRAPVNHVRLRIYPDGGVARFRVYGRVTPEWRPLRDAETDTHVPPALFDLASVREGALALACSDAHFGGMNNLLLPGRAINMGSGWETRRSRAPNRDWIVIKLAARGTPEVIEVDTNHFRGNYPDRCSIDGIDAPGARITDLTTSEAWTCILSEQKLAASTRHFYRHELSARGVYSHLRLNIFPDGGVSRLRVWGSK